MADTGHLPVLAERVVELLMPALTVRTPDDATGPAKGAAAPSGAHAVPDPPVLLDCTVGLGGHAALVLAAAPDARLVGLDRDPAALAVAGERLRPFGSRVVLAHASYDQFGSVLEELDLAQVHGVLFDLGVSSLQLDTAQRGFSYARDVSLDMRMDPGSGQTAAEIVNSYSAEELARVLREYGEERFARRIADAIVRARRAAPLTSSRALADLVRDAVPAPARRSGGNPAKRTFQALRIEVNGELDRLRRALPAVIDALADRGRLVALSYHSLEDRVVKRALQAESTSRLPVDLPVRPDQLPVPRLRLLTRGGERPGDAEVAGNPRAASAHLRAAERVAA
ncbi:MAG: 16S rRNA (cytosine(1402)-N(4))-methyltransferase RsmH [Frankiaceae bacterium]